MRKLGMEELNRPGVDEFRNKRKLPVVVVLDNVRSMNNVGSVFRTADAFLVQKIFLCGITAKPPHREIQKTALGATESVVWEHYGETAECLRQLKSEGFTLTGAEQTNMSILLNNWKPPKEHSLGLIFGNEITGLSDEIMPLLDQAIEIPQGGTKHSLNIAVSAGVVLWEIYKLWV